MLHDENEMMIEYSEMTSFNFNSKEYQEVKNDFLECKETASGMDLLFQNFIKNFRKAEFV